MTTMLMPGGLKRLENPSTSDHPPETPSFEVSVESPLGAKRRCRRVTAAEWLSIGRDPACSIRLPPDDVISRLHVRVRATEGGIEVEDVSTNGTRVGEGTLRRERQIVPDETPLIVGTHRIRIRPERPPLARVLPLPPRDPEPGAQDPAGAATESHPPPTSSDGAAEGRDSVESCDDEAELRREIHRQLIEHLDLGSSTRARLDDPSFRPKVLTALRRIVQSLGPRLPSGIEPRRLIGEMADEALGLGPLEQLLADDTVSEIMVVDPHTVYVERSGRLERSPARFTDEERVRAVIERILTPLGRRIDESSPLVDARLPDGSRVNAVIRPLAINGSSLTIRKFSQKRLSMEDLQGFGSLDARMARFLKRSVVARKNIVISGGTGSGKTTLLNVLSSTIPSSERIVTIEDAAELQLNQPHVVSLESRPPNMEGNGAYTIRDLLKNALRMRPDRIVVGECRGGEALDMLQAMNTGHDGSLTTTHANSPSEAVRRIETLSLMAGVDLPSRAIRQQLASSIHLVVQQSRLSDGSRRVTNVSEVGGLSHEGEVVLRPILEFKRTGTGNQGEIVGRFAASGYLPSYLDELVKMGLIAPGEPFL